MLLPGFLCHLLLFFSPLQEKGLLLSGISVPACLWLGQTASHIQTLSPAKHKQDSSQTRDAALLSKTPPDCIRRPDASRRQPAPRMMLRPFINRRPSRHDSFPRPIAPVVGTLPAHCRRRGLSPWFAPGCSRHSQDMRAHAFSNTVHAQRIHVSLAALGVRRRRVRAPRRLPWWPRTRVRLRRGPVVVSLLLKVVGCISPRLRRLRRGKRRHDGA